MTKTTSFGTWIPPILNTPYLDVLPDHDRTGPTLTVLPEALNGHVDPGAMLHYDQSLEIREPLDPGGAELESR